MGVKVKKGDTVKIITGKDAGKQNEVLAVLPKESKVVVRDCNIVHKAIRPTQQDQQGGIKEQEAALDISNVMVVCPSCSLPTRVGIEVKDGKKVRVCKKCGAQF